MHDMGLGFSLQSRFFATRGALVDVAEGFIFHLEGLCHWVPNNKTYETTTTLKQKHTRLANKQTHKQQRRRQQQQQQQQSFGAVQ